MSQGNPTQVEATTYAESFTLYGDMTRAWRCAFPTSKAAMVGVNSKASTFHKIVKVQERIEELRAIAKRVGEKKFELTVEDLQKTLAMAMKKGLSDKIDAQGNKVSQNLGAVVSAVSEVNKMSGNHAAIKTDNKTAIDLSGMSDAQLQQIISNG